MRDGFNNLIDYTECIIDKPIGQAAYMFAYSLCVCVFTLLALVLMGIENHLHPPLQDSLYPAGKHCS